MQIEKKKKKSLNVINLLKGKKLHGTFSYLKAPNEKNRKKFSITHSESYLRKIVSLALTQVILSRCVQIRVCA